MVAPLGGGLGCPAQRHTIYPPKAASSWRTSTNWLRSNRRAIFARSCGAVLSQCCIIALSLKTHTYLAPCDSFVFHYNKLISLHETPKSTQFSFWTTISRLEITTTEHVQSISRTTVSFPSYFHAKNYTKNPPLQCFEVTLVNNLRSLLTPISLLSGVVLGVAELHFPVSSPPSSEVPDRSLMTANRQTDLVPNKHQPQLKRVDDSRNVTFKSKHRNVFSNLNFHFHHTPLCQLKISPTFHAVAQHRFSFFFILYLHMLTNFLAPFSANERVIYTITKIQENRKSKMNLLAKKKKSD